MNAVNTERPEDEAARPPRRRSRAAVASVAAAVLLVAGGAAYVAATASGGDDGGPGGPAGGGAPPRLALDDAPAGGANGIAPGEPDPYGTVYRAEGGLPDGPRSAAVYRAEGKVTAAEVARLAKALGVPGTPRAEGGSWRVGEGGDGSGPTLRVGERAPGTWTFSRYAPGGDNGCATPGRCKGPGASQADPVDEDTAKEAAAPVLKAVGQDGAKLDADQLTGSVRVVNAEPEIGGLPTYGWTTGVQVGADGRVVGGSGQLKAPVEKDTYPVLGAQETLESMNGSSAARGRAGIGGCTGPVPLEDGTQAPCETSATARPQTAPVTVEKAAFGLAAHSVGGRPALVPSWLFEVRPQGAPDTSVVTRPAVDPAYLAPSGGPDGAEREPSRPGGASEPRDVDVEAYTVDGEELTLRFTGGVCSDYTATVRESAEKVTVEVSGKPQRDRQVCIAVARVYREPVELERGLGDREVVGTDGKPVPEEKGSPARSAE
ncbi:membrane protein [Streptomyces minutiscleroticus]|uniref:Membrane protein n=1 Tax=Streptomyces minutiscleroticus TaxID=68238 RepID=A0A918K9Y4_9ACTN|nr:hypothetical protein [Streptomyces minutiscleroticus]GGX53378.1 membrane protein [Streptomyces minutiscleroticus]